MGANESDEESGEEVAEAAERKYSKSDRIVKEGLILYPNGVIVVPNDNVLRTLLLTEAHDTRMGGHFGAEKTLEKLRRFWTWRGIGK